MRPVLPSSSPREPFLPAIPFNPCDPWWLPQDLRPARLATRRGTQISSYSNDSWVLTANPASIPRLPAPELAYQIGNCDEKRPARVDRARALPLLPGHALRPLVLSACGQRELSIAFSTGL